MRHNSDMNLAVTVIGGSLFLVVTAALSLSLYAESLSATKAAALMACAALSAVVLVVGRYLHPTNAEQGERGARADKRKADS